VETTCRPARYWLRRFRLLPACCIGAWTPGAEGAAWRQAQQAWRHARDLPQLLTTAIAAGLLLGTRIGIYTIMAVAAVVYAVVALL